MDTKQALNIDCTQLFVISVACRLKTTVWLKNNNYIYLNFLFNTLKKTGIYGN